MHRNLFCVYGVFFYNLLTSMETNIVCEIFKIKNKNDVKKKGGGENINGNY